MNILVLFWPDLAKCHYKKENLDFLCNNGLFSVQVTIHRSPLKCNIKPRKSFTFTSFFLTKSVKTGNGNFSILCHSYRTNRVTGKSLSEALILRSTNPQYDKRLFIDLPVQYMKTTSSEHGENMLLQKLSWMSKQKTICVHNMFSPCSGLVVFMYWTGKSMNNLL